MAVQADNKFLAAGALISNAFLWPFLVKVSNGWLIEFILGIRQGYLFCGLALLHSEIKPKLCRVLAILNAIGLNAVHGNVDPNKHLHSNSVPPFFCEINLY